MYITGTRVAMCLVFLAGLFDDTAVPTDFAMGKGLPVID